MQSSDSAKEALLKNVTTGMAVGFSFFLFFGLINALVVIGTTFAWFKQFIQGGTVPPGAKDYLLKFMPIFAISSASNGLVGIVIGGLWGSLIGVWSKIRGRLALDPTERVSLHIASFLAFPFFFLIALSITLFKVVLDKDTVFLEFSNLLVSLIILAVASYVLYRLLKFFLKLLFRVPLFRFPVTRRGYLLLTACYGILICLLSFVPPLRASKDSGDRLPFACSLGQENREELPKILLIVLDTTRADHLSCYGYPRPTTPSIDRIAREGVLFERAYSSAVWTLAGHASIFTGMTPSRDGANGEHLYLDEGFITLAEILSHCGYSTAGFCNNPWVSEFTGLDQGFQHYRKMWLKPYGQNMLLSHAFLRLVQHLVGCVPPMIGSVEATIVEVLDWMKANERDPFFVFINLMEPHPPLNYRETFTRAFLPEGVKPEDLKKVNQNPYSMWAGKKTMTDKDFEAYNALYDGELRFMDHYLGVFFQELESEGLLDETLVIITADHGEQIGEGGCLGHHFSMREALIHVPLIMRYPDHYQGGIRVHQPVQTLDIFPTLLHMLGLEGLSIEKALQGESLYPLPGYKDRNIVAEELRPLLDIKFVSAYKPTFDVVEAYDHRTWAWIDDRYKLVNTDGAKEKIYDLHEDKQEIKDLAETFPAEEKKRLREGLVQWLATLEPYEVNEHDFRFQPDKSTEERLRSLGYIQ